MADGGHDGCPDWADLVITTKSGGTSGLEFQCSVNVTYYIVWLHLILCGMASAGVDFRSRVACSMPCRSASSCCCERARCARQLSDATRRPTLRLRPLTCSTVAKASPSSSQDRITTAINIRSNDDGDNSTLSSVVDDRARRFSTGKLQFAARQVCFTCCSPVHIRYAFLPSFELMTRVGILGQWFIFTHLQSRRRLPRTSRVPTGWTGVKGPWKGPKRALLVVKRLYMSV